MIGDTSSSPGIFHEMKNLGAKIWNPNKIIVTFDHSGSSIAAASARATFRKFAREQGIPPENFFDLGRQGITHQLAAERGYALPGTVHISHDTHAIMLGALGAYAVSLGYELPAYLITGETWLRVPESIKVKVSGDIPSGVMARDLFEWLLGEIGPDGAVYQAMEFVGPTIDAMSIDGRLTICDLVLFMGAVTGIVNPDKKTIDYVKARTTVPFEPLRSDPDAGYADSLDFDVSKLEPQVAVPPKRHTVKPISEVKGVEIDQAFVGSCADGRMEDLRMVAKILRGRKIHPRVKFNIGPASMEVFTQAAREGLLQIFGEAGAFVAVPGCGQCWGADNALTDGEVCVATSTCNYPGRMGSLKAEIYMVSPATAAASAVESKIADPRKYMGR